MGAFIFSSLLYPAKNSSFNFFKHSYLRQKTFDLALAISGFMLMVNAGNDPGLRASFTNMVSYKSNEQQNFDILNNQNPAPKQLFFYQIDKQLQDEQTIVPKKETSKGVKILYTVLVALAALGLGFLVAVAACGIYCNGMAGLAFLTGIGGGALVIASTIWAIKGIWHPKKRKSLKSTHSVQQEGTLQI